MKNISLLKASHIRPWKNSTDGERLDQYNGLLLTPNLDTLFDQGMISFKDSGVIILSDEFIQDDREILGVKSDMKLLKTIKKIEKYMKYHRDNVLKK